MGTLRLPETDQRLGEAVAARHQARVVDARRHEAPLVVVSRPQDPVHAHLVAAARQRSDPPSVHRVRAPARRRPAPRARTPAWRCRGPGSAAVPAAGSAPAPPPASPTRRPPRATGGWPRRARSRCLSRMAASPGHSTRKVTRATSPAPAIPEPRTPSSAASTVPGCGVSTTPNCASMKPALAVSSGSTTVRVPRQRGREALHPPGALHAEHGRHVLPGLHQRGRHDLQALGRGRQPAGVVRGRPCEEQARAFAVVGGEDDQVLEVEALVGERARRHQEVGRRSDVEVGDAARRDLGGADAVVRPEQRDVLGPDLVVARAGGVAVRDVAERVVAGARGLVGDRGDPTARVPTNTT